MTTIIHGQGTNTNPCIDRVWMAVSRQTDGMEGVCAASTPLGMTPLVCTDPKNVPTLRKAAERMATTLDQEILFIEIGEGGRKVLDRWNVRN